MAAKKAKPKKALRKKTEPRKAVGKKPPMRKKTRRAAAASGPKETKKKLSLTRVKITKAKAAPKKIAKAKAAPKKIAKAKAAPKGSDRKPSPPAKAMTPRRASKRAPPPEHAALKTNGVRREDRAGHLDPSYAAELLAKSREAHDASDDQPAFVQGNRSGDGLAEELGEEAVETMTSGEDDGGEGRNEFVDEEVGGPFVESSAQKEFADGSDESNPDDATREPFPKT
jgi:hypothetical protein